MEKGCPQGSIIGPIAWNMCMDDLLNSVSDEFDDKNVEVIAYADDLVALIKGNSRKEIISEIISKTMIGTLMNWCELHKVKASTTKTMAMTIKGKLTREDRLLLNWETPP
jgi:transcription antitermination factor NusA-like protein